jgi:DNA modification methylase
MTLEEIKSCIKQKPFYENEFGVLYCADCLDILPQMPGKCIDLVLTDPPYGIGDMVSGTISSQRLHKTRYSNFADSVEYVRQTVIPAVIECIRVANRVVITPGWKCLRYYPQWDSMGCFYMPSACGMQLWGSSDFQPILYYGKPYDIGKRIHKCSYVLTESPSCKEHPCSKPLKAWQRIVEERSDDGQSIIDCFAGSNTTAVAAQKLGRRWIGIEISPAYCEIAAKRIEAEGKGITVKELKAGQKTLFCSEMENEMQ